MIAKVRGKTLFPSFMLLCFSAAVLLLCIQRQAAAEVSIKSVEATQIKLPPVGAASQYLEKPPAGSSIDDTRLVIELSKRRVYVYEGNQLQTSYPIAIGKAGWETPTGTFQVLQMQIHPAWQHPLTGKVISPGRDNPLGVRWIGFWTDGRNYIGFHGTPQEKLIGRAVSHGCIRMRNRDILALYPYVKIGTPVIVKP